MTFATRILVVRKILCTVLLAAVAAKAHAGAIADGFAIAGEHYAASLVGGSPTARKPPRAEAASPIALTAPSDRRVDRVATKGAQVYQCRAKADAAGEARRVFVERAPNAAD